MKKLVWWLRIVGVFYLFLTLLNLWAIFFNPDFFRANLPYQADNLVVRVFSEAWLAFILELGVLGGMLLYASRQPERSRLLVLTVIWAEVFRGIVDDVFFLSRGYPTMSYIPFIVIHLIIIITGIIFLREAKPN
jgi:hypothetical protein